MELITPGFIVLFILLGAVAGLLAGLLGIGGGIILVPLFLHIFPLIGFPPEYYVHLALGTSLGIILPTAISSTFGHRKRGNVDWRQVGFLTIGGVAGAVAGSHLAAGLNGRNLQLLFAGMQILVAGRMLVARNYLPPERSTRVPPWMLILVGLCGGSFSAFFGVGGGVVAVPMMVILVQLPIHLAVGNSSALIVVSSLAGMLSYIATGSGEPGLPPWSFGYVNLLVVLLVAPLAILFARLGVRIAGRLPHDKMVKAFAALLILVGLKMGYQVLF
ncbi:hypothetical protein C2E25_14340 [Geothermobacter hydrogeniphilus]|uniref:Probable membrane transporter protein n=1 Tax=Geothermobacter hydrogeniphilus TaxID=1969733 RepID=A0A2K2H6W5_9BACT|nr:sulfite exporter TauE/SafE family protein [Geothermobacter hydrogeniphilus]PNU19054.1 hypothetical protein C2E25_14340 [Geothermobacter hydrogeniphilus]